MENYNANLVNSLPTDIDNFQVPKICLKSLELKNFGIYDDIFFDFLSDKNTIEPLTCLIGPNGCGKTTILTAIQILFSKYNIYDDQRYKSLFSRYVRNYKKLNASDLEKADLLVKGHFLIDGGEEYDVCVTRQNRVTSFHPESISNFLPYMCFAARFDQELDIFQLNRGQWEKFKNLFEVITGYEIEEDISLFDQSEDTRLNNLLKEYVLGFNVKKEDDIVNHKQCSAGEKKVIKTFSTILNKPVIPRIILIDNAVMHVESERHLYVIKAIEDCFSDSQIILTCHSEPVKRSLKDRNKIIDLRCMKLANSDDLWKIRYVDELNEITDKVKACNTSSLKCKDDLRNILHLVDEINDLINEIKSDQESDDNFIGKQFVIGERFVELSCRAYKIINEHLKNNYRQRIRKMS